MDEKRDGFKIFLLFLFLGSIFLYFADDFKIKNISLSDKDNSKNNDISKIQESKLIGLIEPSLNPCLNLTKDLFESCETEILNKISSLGPCDILEGESKIFCENKNKDCVDDTCYFEKAQLNSNETFCFEIENLDMRAGCSVVITETNSFELSVINKDVSFCDNLVDNRKIDCYDNFYLSLKYNHNDKSFCNKIINENLKLECNQ